MKSLSESWNTEWSYYDGGYESLVDSFEVEAMLEEHDHDYQGDSFYLLRNRSGEYGILIFGWGSCSGCDALQACSSLNDVENLRDSLWDSIVWMTLDDLSAYVKSKDFSNDFYFYSSSGKRFVSALCTFCNVSNESLIGDD